MGTLPLPHTTERAQRGLVGLLDVLQRYSFSFYELLHQAGVIHRGAKFQPAGTTLDFGAPGEFSSFLDQLKIECDVLGLDATGASAVHTKSRFVDRGKEYTYAELVGALDSLVFSFINELRRELFFRIPRDKEPYFQRDDLFGPEVAAAFPSSADDIQHAGTCFALGLAHACVFHLMRVLERGLRAIAGELGVEFDNKTWANVIDAIEAAIKKSATSTGVDVKRRKVMAEAAVHLRFVKDAWRNDVMHAGEPYDTGKAQSVLDHVRDFMRALADAGLAEPAP